ncbi:MAG TPA: hypothetical protein VK638_38335 [Edaphobacter sp.]|nr:hypothetical protein [Edaphobacter sp.]
MATTSCMLFVGTGALAQNSRSGVGTWKLDLPQSDFGCEPALKSATINILEDRPEMLSWRVHLIDAKGNVVSYSWSGPRDGSMHPVKENGRVIAQQSAKKDNEGALLRHGESPEGESFDAREVLSADGNTMTDEITQKSKDGKVCNEKYVYHKASGGAHEH